MSISKNQLKLITSLSQKKYRIKHQLFIAEGVKVVEEILDANYKVHLLFCTNDFICNVEKNKVIVVSEKELKKISKLKTPNKVFAIFEFPAATSLKENGLILALDAINDPGNLGTIIRLCDWFGVTQLVCSLDTVDAFNQKVVQASMGSVTRVSIVYTDLHPYIKATKLPVFIADMEGSNVYTSSLPKEAVLIMGNEANGISDSIRNLVPHKISIPRFGELQETESLNVATATAILLSEFKRSSVS